jgi:hypothetical protein
MNKEQHCDRIYRAKAPSEVSWYPRKARLSLELISPGCTEAQRSLVNLGAGASTLDNGLLAGGYRRVLSWAWPQRRSVGPKTDWARAPLREGVVNDGSR